MTVSMDHFTNYPLQLAHPQIRGGKSIFAIIFQDHIEFKNKQTLKGALQIDIPYFMQSEFEGKSHVDSKDPLYVNAFIKAYFPFVLKSQGYLLKDKDNNEISPS
jgi:hypothetical protein